MVNSFFTSGVFGQSSLPKHLLLKATTVKCAYDECGCRKCHLKRSNGVVFVMPHMLYTKTLTIPSFTSNKIACGLPDGR